ncbi:Usher syndrome type-1G protein homolog [Lytechinus variegatus]|uniref:Usher syndrome type-1G protein homolog n=1 Tax=Lytechinus variegatus TaxID=7654 RepID=UPI001BB24DF9|nr:Usher syndrome type-1G protein homolog [Lytechinus variegatus]
MTTKFHEAAKEGHLDPLREATKRDCNRTDESGRTPTLWAATNGHTDALRLIVSRGGDPDKADLQGHTSLHVAALYGHITIIEYLVSFGCNLWALNNDYKTAMALASEVGKEEIVKILDDVSGRQAATNKKVVQKAKQKAIKDADDRVKKLDKMVKEHQKQMAREVERQSKNKGNRKPSTPGMSESSYSDVLHSRVTKRDSLMLPDATEGTSNHNRKRGDGDGTSSTGVPASESGSTENSGETSANYQDSRFWLPNRNATAMMSLPREDNLGDIDDALATLDNSIDDVIGHPSEPTKPRRMSSDKDTGSHHSRTAKPGDSISTVFRGNEAMWAEVDIDLEDEVDASSSAIELFLTTNDLEDYIPVFFEEDIDMKALELLTEQDIVDLKLPLGPRRKLNRAIAKRKEILATPSPMRDSAM